MPRGGNTNVMIVPSKLVGKNSKIRSLINYLTIWSLFLGLKFSLNSSVNYRLKKRIVKLWTRLKVFSVLGGGGGG